MKVRMLEYHRSNAYLTQEALASRSGVSKDTISKLETGERVNAHAKTAVKLAEALGVLPIQLEGSPTHDELREESRMRDGDASGGRLLWNLRKRKRVGLNITETERAKLAYIHRRTLDELLPEDTPIEAYFNLEWMALVFQEWGYEEARSRAESSVYGSDEEF